MADSSSLDNRMPFVPFKLDKMTFPVLRNFLDIMPLKDLHDLRRLSSNIRHLSRFRGEIAYQLRIISDTVKPWTKFEKFYSEVINRPFCTTPFYCFHVYMGPDICPTTLLSKMDQQSYSCLHIAGDYHWREAVLFFHASVTQVCLYGNMDMPGEDRKEFFQTLLQYKTTTFCICNGINRVNWPFITHDKLMVMSADYFYQEYFCKE